MQAGGGILVTRTSLGHNNSTRMVAPHGRLAVSQIISEQLACVRLMEGCLGIKAKPQNKHVTEIDQV